MTPGPNGGAIRHLAFFVYILASRLHGTLYIGVTNDMARRVWEHRQGKGSLFAKRYKVHRLVHMEAFDDPRDAIQREKTLKDWQRAWKIALIEKDNPDWRDLYEELNQQAPQSHPPRPGRPGFDPLLSGLARDQLQRHLPWVLGGRIWW